MGYHLFDHTADLGVEVSAPTQEGLYANAVLALFDQLTDLPSVRAQEEREVEATGENPSDLLVDLLREVLFAWNGEGFLVKSCLLEEVGPKRLKARLRGEAFDPLRHQVKREIKAVTYHQAEVRKTPGKGWVARIVFDL